MTHYKVKATIEVEVDYDTECARSMSAAFKEAEDMINRALLKTDLFLTCKIKKAKIQLEDN